MNPEDAPPHHRPISLHMETGSIGEIGGSWFSFLRGVLRASETIDQRRADRQHNAGAPGETDCTQGTSRSIARTGKRQNARPERA
jgi:hypothetical protein